MTWFNSLWLWRWLTTTWQIVEALVIVNNSLRACLHWGGGPQVGEVTCLGGAKKYPSSTCNLTTPPSRGALSQDYWMVAKHVNKKMLANHVFWRLMHFYTHLLLLLQPSVQWLSIVNLNNAWCKATAKVNFARIWCTTNPTPARRVTPPWNVYMANLTPDERVTRSGRPGYPPRRVTPPII